MRKMFYVKLVVILAAGLCLIAEVAEGDTFNLIHSFIGTDGAQPDGDVVQVGNTLFGVTTLGGGTTGSKANTGTLFSVNTDGSHFTNLITFGPVFFNSALNLNTNMAGANPLGTPVLSGNMLYGTTLSGGLYGDGVIYSVNTNGAGFTVLWNFAGTNGSTAYPSLALAGQTLFGATEAGGTGGCGTLYKINTDGTGFTVLKNFIYTNGNYPDGGNLFGGLIVSGSMIYGTASVGGLYGYGLVFSADTNGGNFDILHSFADTDVSKPFSGLTLSGAALYGTTYQGGPRGGGTVFTVNTDGSGFTVLHSFTNDPDGFEPDYGAPVLSGSVLYGTTYAGGATGDGTIYQVNTNGTGYSVIYNFSLSPTNGYDPEGGVLVSGDTLIGMTSEGGSTGAAGTVYALSLTPSYAVIDLVSRPSSSDSPFQFSYHGTPGAQVIIQASANLNAWIAVQTNILGTGSMQFTDTAAPNFPARFYRVSLP